MYIPTVVLGMESPQMGPRHLHARPVTLFFYFVGSLGTRCGESSSGAPPPLSSEHGQHHGHGHACHALLLSHVSRWLRAQPCPLLHSAQDAQRSASLDAQWNRIRVYVKPSICRLWSIYRKTRLPAPTAERAQRGGPRWAHPSDWILP